MSISDLKGFYFHDGSYKSQIKTGGNVHHLGNYKLASDAALAYDNAQKLRKCPNLKTNFSKEQQHKNLRALESRRTGLNVDFASVQAYMASRLDFVATNIRASAEKDSGLNSGGDGEKPLSKKMKRKR